MSTLPITKAFASYLTDERHFSPYTARCYGADLRQFVEFLVDEFGIEIDEAKETQAYQHLVNQAKASPLRSLPVVAELVRPKLSWAKASGKAASVSPRRVKSKL